MDFTRDSLRDRLRQAGFDFAAPAFVSWLGTTMYLAESAIEQTLAVIGGFAPGSELIVDYMLPAGLRDAAGDSYAEQVGQASAEWGEPWLSLFGPDEAAALLRRHGFRPVRDVRQRDMIPAAAWERTDSLRPADLSRIAHAQIPGGPDFNAPLRRGRTDASGGARPPGPFAEPPEGKQGGCGDRRAAPGTAGPPRSERRSRR